jgi:hypothetical protein
MKIGVWNYYEQLSTNNYMFTHAEAPIGDALLRPFNMLYAQAKTRGITLMTLDLITDWDAMDAFLFMDMPSAGPLVRKAFDSKKPKALVTWENEMIRPSNWDEVNLGLFDRVFTWHDGLVGGDLSDPARYVKINYAHLFPPTIGYANIEKRKLCTTIACNKTSAHPKSLYQARVQGIRFFEQRHPDDFDLYGVGWDPKLFPSYRGPVAAKRPILAPYKFALCFENAHSIPGYITEKIFDCFFAGTVPLYLGAPNVETHIPPECFIDVRDVTGFEELYEIMKTMTPDEYAGRLDVIERYLRSEQAKEFAAQTFVDTIITNFGG